jgi:hypothetical protein
MSRQESGDDSEENPLLELPPNRQEELINAYERFEDSDAADDPAVNRRGVLAGIATLITGSAIGTAGYQLSTEEVAAATAAVGQVGEPGNTVDVYGDGVTANSVDTDRIDTEHRVGADDDLQAVYDSAGENDLVVVVEDYDLDSTFVMDRQPGPVVEIRSLMVPTGDFTGIEITASGSTLIGQFDGPSSVFDADGLTTAGSHAIHVKDRAALVGMRAAAFGGHGVYLNQESGINGNLNSSIADVKVANCGGDGIRVENTSGQAPDVNDMTITARGSFSNGGAGINIIDGRGSSIEFGKVNQNGDYGLNLQNGVGSCIGGATENNTNGGIRLGSVQQGGLVAGHFKDDVVRADANQCGFAVFNTRRGLWYPPSYSDANRPSAKSGSVIYNPGDGFVNVGNSGAWTQSTKWQQLTSDEDVDETTAYTFDSGTVTAHDAYAVYGYIAGHGTGAAGDIQITVNNLTTSDYRFNTIQSGTVAETTGASAWTPTAFDQNGYQVGWMIRGAASLSSQGQDRPTIAPLAGIPSSQTHLLNGEYTSGVGDVTSVQVSTSYNARGEIGVYGMDYR